MHITPLDLSMDHQLMWSALAAGLEPGKKSYPLSLVFLSNIAPTTYLTKKIIGDLREAGVVSITEEPVRKAKLSKGGDSEVNECLSLDNDDQLLENVLKNLASGQISRSDSLLVAELALEAITTECMDHLRLFLKRVGADLGSDFPPPQSLVEIVSYRSAAEASMLLWRSVSSCDAKDLRLLRVTRSPVQVIELMCNLALEFHLEYQAGHKVVKTFRRPIGFNSSTLSSILFDHVLKVGPKYFELVRPWEIEIVNDSPPDAACGLRGEVS